MPSLRKKNIPSCPIPRPPKPSSKASSPNFRPGPLALAATRRLNYTNQGSNCLQRHFRFPVPGSSPLTGQRKKIYPIASRPPSTGFPANGSLQLHSMVSSPKPRMASNHEISQQFTTGLPNGVVSSPKARVVSTHEDSQRLNHGPVATRTLPNLALSCKGPAKGSPQHNTTVSSSSTTTRMVSNQESLQRLTPGLVATSRTPPNRALSSPCSSSGNLVSPTPLSMPVPGQKSRSNNQPALNLLQTLDKRRKPVVLSQAR